jgi:hypothetical protein
MVSVNKQSSFDSGNSSLKSEAKSFLMMSGSKGGSKPSSSTASSSFSSLRLDRPSAQPTASPTTSPSAKPSAVHIAAINTCFDSFKARILDFVGQLEV